MFSHTNIPVPQVLRNRWAKPQNQDSLTKTQFLDYNWVTKTICTRFTQGNHNPIGVYSKLTITAIITSIIISGVCFVYALIHPNPVIRNNIILEDTTNHNLYVVVNNQIYPTPDIVSARLIINQYNKPVKIEWDTLRKHAIHETIGLNPPVNLTITPTLVNWVTCSTRNKSIIYKTNTLPQTSSDMFLVKNPTDNTIWFIQGKNRYLTPSYTLNLFHIYNINTTHLPVVSVDLLNMFTVKKPLTPPHIPGIGEMSHFFPTQRIGDVYVWGTRFFLTLDKGFTEITSLEAWIITLNYNTGMIKTIHPSYIMKHLRYTSKLTSYPPNLSNTNHSTHLCAGYDNTGVFQGVVTSLNTRSSDATYKYSINRWFVNQDTGGTVVRVLENPDTLRFIDNTGVKHGLNQQSLSSLKLEVNGVVDDSVAKLLPDGVALTQVQALKTIS